MHAYKKLYSDTITKYFYLFKTKIKIVFKNIQILYFRKSKNIRINIGREREILPLTYLYYIVIIAQFLSLLIINYKKY